MAQDVPVKCRVCGKLLTVPKSMDEGIGPECALVENGEATVFELLTDVPKDYIPLSEGLAQAVKMGYSRMAYFKACGGNRNKYPALNDAFQAVMVKGKRYVPKASLQKSNLDLLVGRKVSKSAGTSNDKPKEVTKKETAKKDKAYKLVGSKSVPRQAIAAKKAAAKKVGVVVGDRRQESGFKFIWKADGQWHCTNSEKGETFKAWDEAKAWAKAEAAGSLVTA